MANPDFSNETKRLAARTQTLRALNAQTTQDSDTTRTTKAPKETQRAVSRNTRRTTAPPPHERPSTRTQSGTVARWSNRMASLNTEIPFDMRERIDELYVKRRKLDKREGRKLTTYADLTTEAFELLLHKLTA